MRTLKRLRRLHHHALRPLVLWVLFGCGAMSLFLYNLFTHPW